VPGPPHFQNCLVLGPIHTHTELSCGFENTKVQTGPPKMMNWSANKTSKIFEEFEERSGNISKPKNLLMDGNLCHSFAKEKLKLYLLQCPINTHYTRNFVLGLSIFT
jgi:hypothetical protein